MLVVSEPMHWTEHPAGDDQLRASVRAEIEIASGQAMSVSDSLPDELIAACQIEKIPLSMLNLWIHSDKGDHGWSAPAFVRWTRSLESAVSHLRALAEARP